MTETRLGLNITNMATGRIFEVKRVYSKFPDWIDNEIYAYNNKHSLRSNTKDYGGKTH
jgi:hypothetical protein